MSIISEDRNNSKLLNQTNQAVIDIESIVELKKQFDACKETSLTSDTIQLLKTSLESIDARYGSKNKIALESLDDKATFGARVKEIIKRIIQAIADTIEIIISSFNRYRTDGEMIIDKIDSITRQTKGHVGIQRRDLRIESDQLATSLFLSKGSGNVRESYRKVIDVATHAYDSSNYQALENILHKLQTATDDKVDDVKDELLKVIVAPIKQLLTNNNPPQFLSDRNTRENSNLVCAGPFLGERYLYAYCPRDSKHLSEFHIGSLRDFDSMIVREKLLALSTSDIWDICQKARKFAEMIIDFGGVDIKLKKLLKLSKELINNIDSPKVVSAAGIYPVALKGLHYSALNMGVDTTFSMLEYCQKSIKAQISAEKP